MKSCSLSKLPFFIALLHLSLTVSARVQHEDDRQSLSIALHSPPFASGWRALSARGSSHVEALDTLATVVEATKARVAALKTGSAPPPRPDDNTKTNDDYLESLYPRGYGAYSLSVSLGTPPQKLYAVMDTGSDIVWVPCTGKYTCKKCTTPPGSHPIFAPEKSSSVSRVSCANPDCKYLHRNNTEKLCFANGKCAGTLSNCARVVCPNYTLWYGKGSTAGYLRSDTLTLAVTNGGKRGIRRFGFGCSKISSQVPSGVGTAGFGRGRLSLPSQLSSVIGDKFAYCLLSHAYDSRNRSSIMVLGNDAVPKGVSLHYTPFLINRKAQNSAYGVYYYIGLTGISIGRKLLKLPSKLLGLDQNGHGGTIIDSGTTFSVIDAKIFKEIEGGFDSQVGYRRARAIEAKTGLGLCYDISGQKKVSVPRFALYFRGGARMSLPFQNYFKVWGGAMCLTVLSTQNRILNLTVGPAVILGNYQQQNFYILYDRENNRLGFTQQRCKSSG